MDYPTLLDDQPAKVFAYSLESMIAEKFEAIVSLGEVNGRLKDFYDICSLAERMDFDGEKLQAAIRETFSHRNTSLNEIAAFDDRFTLDPVRASRWKGFLKSKNVLSSRSFTDVLHIIIHFLNPVVESINSDAPFKHKWSHAKMNWTNPCEL